MDSTKYRLKSIHRFIHIHTQLTFCLLPIGGAARDSQIRFGLSAEEVGFLLHQLPDEPVELVRVVQSSFTTTDSSTSNEPTLEKVLKITPAEAGQCSFLIDFEKEGIGGQASGGENSVPLGPQEVVVQLGEMQVIRSLLESSIPVLTGWDTQMSQLMEQTLAAAAGGGGGGRDSSY